MAVAGKVAITLATENDGKWSADISYEKLVAVTHNNNMYISRKQSIGVEPPNNEFWFPALEGYSGDELTDILSGKKQVGNAKTLDGNGVSYFAKDSDLIVERERISNLARLNEGSTTGDAELVDARVGADGKTYNNVGDAVRGQVSDLKSDLRELLYNDYVADWEVGNISPYGENTDATKNIRTKSFLSDTVLSVSCTTDYLFAVAIYDTSGNFIERTGFEYSRYRNFDFGLYNYRITVRRIDDGAMTISDGANIVMETKQGVLNEIDYIADFEPCKDTTEFLTWEAGSIDSDGQNKDDAERVRTQTGVYYHFYKGEKIKNMAESENSVLWFHFYSPDGSVQLSDYPLYPGDEYTFEGNAWCRFNIYVGSTDVSLGNKFILTYRHYQIIREIKSLQDNLSDVETFPTIGGLRIGNMEMIGGTQSINDFDYCSWPYNTAIYDKTESSVSVFYACKSHHTSEDGVWLMKKYHTDTDLWDAPVVVASGDGLCFYGYATAIDDNGNYIGLCKDNMYTGNIYICKSTDKGSTWTRELLIVDGNTIIGDCPCSLRKLSNGRWCFFLAIVNKFIYSDDNMSTWHAINLTGISGSSYEAEILELEPGQLIMMVRLGTGGTTRFYPLMLISDDCGNTWGAAQEMKWIDASAAPISAYYDAETLQIYLFHISRYLVNGCLRFNVSVLSKEELKNNLGGYSKCIWKAEAIADKVGNTGYGSVVGDGKNLYYFIYKGAGSMENNPKIYWSRMTLNEVDLLA